MRRDGKAKIISNLALLLVIFRVTERQAWLSKSVKQCCDHNEQKRGACCFIALEHSVLHGEWGENSQRLVNGSV